MSLIADIKKHEGYRKTVYKDHLGNDTIGIGFLVSALELDEDVCDIILERKLEKNKKILRRKLPFFDNIPKDAQDILEEMFYQLHYKLFKFSKTLKYVEEARWIMASKEMLDSRWAEQCPNRAKYLSEKMARVVYYD